MRPDRGIGTVVLASLFALPLVSLAEGETGIALADGPGRDQVRAACSTCHSLDYIVMNSPFLDRSGWQKTVDKMIAVMGAPLTDEEVATIVAYLERHYGK